MPAAPRRFRSTVSPPRYFERWARVSPGKPGHLRDAAGPGPGDRGAEPAGMPSRTCTRRSWPARSPPRRRSRSGGGPPPTGPARPLLCSALGQLPAACSAARPAKPRPAAPHVPEQPAALGRDRGGFRDPAVIGRPPSGTVVTRRPSGRMPPPGPNTTTRPGCVNDQASYHSDRHRDHKGQHPRQYAMTEFINDEPRGGGANGRSGASPYAPGEPATVVHISVRRSTGLPVPAASSWSGPPWPAPLPGTELCS